MKKLLRANDDRVVLCAVEMVWVAFRRIPPKGARVTICDQNHVATSTPHRSQACPVSPAQQLNREHYQEAIMLVRRERERMEREAEKRKQGDRPAE
jgi:hypothetical protein